MRPSPARAAAALPGRAPPTQDERQRQQQRRRTSIPDLCLNDLAIVRDAARRKLDANRRLGVEVELVPRESAEQVGLADARVTDDHNCAARAFVVSRHQHAGNASAAGGAHL
jgi:hypothetical protein